MLWSERVNERIPMETWLMPGNFPPGIVSLAREREDSRPPEQVLQGHLFLVPKVGAKEDERKIAEIVGPLKNHADLAEFCLGCRVPFILKSRYWLDTDEDGNTAIDRIEQADILVMIALENLTPDEYDVLDRMLSARAFGSPKVTVLLMEKKTKKMFPRVQEMYGDRTYVCSE